MTTCNTGTLNWRALGLQFALLSATRQLQRLVFTS